MLSCHHTCMYLMPSTQLSKVCCCRTVVYIQRMLGHHASTLGTTQTHGTVLLVASGMSANRSKDSYKCTSRLTLSRVEPVLLLRRLCQCHWNDWPKYAQKAVTFSSSVQSVTNKSFWTVLLLNLLASWCNWLECRSCRKCRVYRLLYDQTLLQCKSRLRHDTPILRQQCTGGLANASKTIVQLVRESMHASMRWMMPSCLIDMTFHIHVSDWVNGIIVSSQVSLAHVAEFEMKQAVANFFSIYFTHRFAHSHGRWQSHWSCVWGCEWQWRSCWGVSVVTTTNSSRRTNNVGRATTCFTHAQNPGFPAQGAWLRHIARRVNTRDSKLNEIQQQHNWFSIT